MMRITVLFNRLGPYHHARLIALSTCCQLSCVEISGVDQTYQWTKIEGASGFQRVTLFAEADAKLQPGKEMRRRIVAALDELHPKVVAICGWSDRAAIMTLIWCRENGVPAIVMSESQAIDEDRVWWKEFLKRFIVRQFSAGFVGGRTHADYIQQLGMPRELIFTGYDVVDNRYFLENSDKARNNATAWRNKLALPRHYFLASNRFIEKKNIPRLLQAFARYRENSGGAYWSLILLGDGELKPEIIRIIEELGLVDDVVTPGFKQYDELPAYYGLASAFIHASTVEQWGLVVNEAMAAGLPVLVSNRCGCTPDLVQCGKNGYTFDPYDVEELTGLMLQISSGACNLTAMGQTSREIVAEWSPDTFAANLLKAAEAAANILPTRPTLWERVMLNCLAQR